jgi:hypothetical protein
MNNEMSHMLYDVLTAAAMFLGIFGIAWVAMVLLGHGS